MVIAAACCAALAAAPASMAHASAGRPNAVGAALNTAPPTAGATLRITPAKPGAAPTTTSPSTRPADGDRARRAQSRRHRRRHPGRRHRRADGPTGTVTAHAAGDPAVTVADFHFSPSSTTIHVGDTITWTNDGPSSHTATARNGGFDTGVLKKGHSASHTFTQAGTFTYFCQIHPFMHGTIVVLAATTSTTSAHNAPAASTTPATTAPAPTATTATDSPTTAAASAGPTLPNTGFSVAACLEAAGVLLGAGVALRRVRSR
jgi:plastocyanin